MQTMSFCNLNLVTVTIFLGQDRPHDKRLHDPCVPIPPRPHEYINFFKPFQSCPVNHLVVQIGASYISSWLQEIQSRECEERTKNKQTIRLGST